MIYQILGVQKQLHGTWGQVHFFGKVPSIKSLGMLLGISPVKFSLKVFQKALRIKKNKWSINT